MQYFFIFFIFNICFAGKNKKQNKLSRSETNGEQNEPEGTLSCDASVFLALGTSKEKECVTKNPNCTDKSICPDELCTFRCDRGGKSETFNLSCRCGKNGSCSLKTKPKLKPKKLAKRNCDGKEDITMVKDPKPKPNESDKSQCKNMTKKFKFGTIDCGNKEEISINTTCTLTCDEGYKFSNDLPGSQTIDCLPGGKWSQKTPKCLKIGGRNKCSEQITKQISTAPFKADMPIAEEGYGTVTCTDGRWEESTCSLLCDELYSPSPKAQNVATCVCKKQKKSKQRKGAKPANCNWQFPESKPPMFAQCAADHCTTDKMHAVNNSKLTCTSFISENGIETVKAGDYCKYECIDGYKFVENSWNKEVYNSKKGMVCLWGKFDFFTGEWDANDLPDCEKISWGILCDYTTCKLD